MTEATTVLVVANETLVGDELVDSLRRRAEHGPVRAVVVAPVTPPREGYVVYRDSRRAAAGRRTAVHSVRAHPTAGDLGAGAPGPTDGRGNPWRLLRFGDGIQ